MQLKSTSLCCAPSPAMHNSLHNMSAPAATTRKLRLFNAVRTHRSPARYVAETIQTRSCPATYNRERVRLCVCRHTIYACKADMVRSSRCMYAPQMNVRQRNTIPCQNHWLRRSALQQGRSNLPSPRSTSARQVPLLTPQRVGEPG